MWPACAADILNALQGQNGAPRMLYAAIFLAQRCTAQQRQGWAQQRRQQQAPKPQLPKPPRRIPASLKPLLAALRCMLGACSTHKSGILTRERCKIGGRAFTALALSSQLAGA